MKVFEGHGQSVERPERLSLLDAPIGSVRQGQTLRVVELGNDGVDGRIDSVDPLEMGGHDLPRRYLSRPDERGEVSRILEAEVARACCRPLRRGLGSALNGSTTQRGGDCGPSAGCSEERPSVMLRIHVASQLFQSGSEIGPACVLDAKDGDTLVILVGGGAKKHQQRDIAAAQERWKDYKRRKTQEKRSCL